MRVLGSNPRDLRVARLRMSIWAPCLGDDLGVCNLADRTALSAGHGFSNLEALVGLVLDSKSYWKRLRWSRGSFHPFALVVVELHTKHRDPDGHAIVKLGPL